MVQLKKGFTLVELIGVIAVLGIILLVTIPTLTSTLRSNSDQKYENTLQDIYLATEQYTLNYKEQFPSLEQIGGSAMVTIETLKNAGYINENLENPNTGAPFQNNDYIEVTIVEDYKRTYSFHSAG